MNRARSTPVTPSRRNGFSLLEVILATAILSGSTVMLLSILATGERHARQAEQRVLGQMLCQSLLDELIANPAQRRTVDQEPVDGYPEWIYSFKEKPTQFPSLMRWEISVNWINPEKDIPRFDPASQRNVFELVRLQRIPANATNSVLGRIKGNTEQNSEGTLENSPPTSPAVISP